MSPAEHQAEAERLLDSAEHDELKLQARREAHERDVNIDPQHTAHLERELDVLLRLAAVHATLATAPR